jgi:hypothetical protein
MDKYGKLMIGVIALIILSVITYFVLLVMGVIESKFPYGVLIPSWLVVLIPIINQKRIEEENKLRNLSKGGEFP